MINKELLKKVRDQITSEPECFDWTEWQCGTQACIGGWANRLCDVNNESMFCDETAAMNLGLDDEQTCFLFYGQEYDGPDGTHWPESQWHYMTRQSLHDEAIRRIDYILSLEGATDDQQES